MSENTMACTCGHLERDHSTQEQIRIGYPAGCTAVVVDSPDPRFLELCGCTDLIPLPPHKGSETPAPLPRAGGTR